VKTIRSHALLVLAATALVALLGSQLMLHAEAQQVAAAFAVPPHVAPPAAPEQPIAYSHRTHLALGLDCEACHTNPAASAAVGLPSAATCMGCHANIATTAPAIQNLARLAAAGTPIEWARVYQGLPGVTWSHAPHRAAGVECTTCHGDVAAADAMAVTTAVTAMATCIGCHEAHGASVTCETCHAWPTP
jgi:hypothetical protein